MNAKEDQVNQEQDDYNWGVGEVRRAVVRENTRDDYDNLITYAPDGRVIVLYNETGNRVEPGDVVEIFILEEKPRSYYGRIMEVAKKYTEIKEIADERGEQFENELLEFINKRKDSGYDDKLIEIKEQVDSIGEELENEIKGVKQLLKYDEGEGN